MMQNTIQIIANDKPHPSNNHDIRTLCAILFNLNVNQFFCQHSRCLSTCLNVRTQKIVRGKRHGNVAVTAAGVVETQQGLLRRGADQYGGRGGCGRGKRGTFGRQGTGTRYARFCRVSVTLSLLLSLYSFPQLSVSTHIHTLHLFKIFNRCVFRTHEEFKSVKEKELHCSTR